jgi:hypothetical protein
MQLSGHITLFLRHFALREALKATAISAVWSTSYSETISVSTVLYIQAVS